MVSQHQAVSLGFRANFEKIPGRALTPLSFGGSGGNFQDLKGRLTATITALDIILEAAPDFLLCLEVGGNLCAGHTWRGAAKIILRSVLVAVTIPFRS